MITAYCKKCKKDVSPADLCPNCGGKLGKNALRAAWCVRHHPVTDWMCWNSVLRLLVPVWGVIVLIVLISVLISSGLQGLAEQLQSLVFLRLMLLPVILLPLLGLILLLQGTDLVDCVVDSRGIHVRRYLLHPNAFRLMLHLVPPSKMALRDTGSDVLLFQSLDIKWNELARVQLWPEKLMILLYAPYWWMRIALPCTYESWKDTIAFMRDKVGRKKNLLLPPELVAPPKPKQPRRNTAQSAPPLPMIVINDDPVDDQ